MSHYIDKPIDTLFIRTESRTVFEVVRRIEQEIFKTSPDFQRNFIWSEVERSKLIESALMRIPLPVIYMAENQNGDVVVVDGKQRLSTFFSFIKNEFSLCGMDRNKSLNGRYFDDLPLTLRNRIEDTQLIIYTLDYKIDEAVRLDIFERVNSGRPISRQEMRNCLYTGDATRLTIELSQNTNFQKILGDFFNKNKKKSISSDSDKRAIIEPMLDRLYANRFISFYCLGHNKYNQDNMMDVYLSDGLKHINSNKDLYNKVNHAFSKSMANCYKVFGVNAFRKITPTRKGPINIGLFDVIRIVFSKITTDTVRKRKDDIYTTFMSLIEDKEFSKCISSATN
ncbi:DUF262 domain-containing protein, partial [Aeromonas media]|uniref:DUF262 domain-containing protein n=1 Tax=Aeromonas media TaxID=651 RepID=UPI003D06D24E